MVQIIGTKKSSSTKKAMRYFSDRGIKYQLVDLAERGLSRGELENLGRGVEAPEDLLDTESSAYKKRGMQYMEFDVLEELEADPMLLVKPVVRLRSSVVVGVDEDRWNEIAEQSKS